MLKSMLDVNQLGFCTNHNNKLIGLMLILYNCTQAQHLQSK
jgi:hypothetical protein